MNTFKAFLLAYADKDYKKVLSIWDQFHKLWNSNEVLIANTIIQIVDKPKPLF